MWLSVDSLFLSECVHIGQSSFLSHEILVILVTNSSVEHETTSAPVNPADLGAQTVVNPEGRPSQEQSASNAPSSSPEIPAQASTSLWQSLFPSDDSHHQVQQAQQQISLGHFEIEKRIGQGGMGAVFKALDTELKRIVALKVLSPQQTYDASSVKRFRNEARAAAQLDHDRIARVYSIDQDQGLTFIAFEYVEGWNVRELINRSGRLSIADAVNYTLQIAGALQYTAASGVFHRDIKPSNIIIMPDGRAKLVDWGLARQESPGAEGQPDLTVSGTTLGTFDYISPEQAKDPRQVDARSDLYSLGCTLYHMVTGEAPYATGTVLQKLLDHQSEAVPNPREIRPEIPQPVAQVIMKLMASKPEKRYQSPAELIRDLLPIASELGLQPTQIDRLIWNRSDAQSSSTALAWNRSTWAKIAGLILCSVFLVEVVMQVLIRQFFPTPTIDLETIALQSPAQNSAVVSRNDSATATNSPPAIIETSINENINAPEIQPDNVLEAVPPMTFDLQGTPPITPVPLQDAMQATNRTASPGVGVNLSNEILETWTGPSISGAGVDPATLRSSETTTSPGTLGTQARPFLVHFADGSTIKRYETLSAALAEAATGSIIELQYNGSWDTPLRWEGAIRLIDQQLTIRGAPGYSPTLHFMPEKFGNDYESQFLYVRGGSLDLVNLNLIMQIPAGLMAPEAALINAVNCEALRLKDVTMTMIGTSLPTASAIRWSLSEADRMSYLEQEQATPQIELEQVVVRGSGDLFVSDSPVPANLELDNCLIAITGTTIVQIAQEENTIPTDLLKVSMQHVTSINGNGLLNQIVTEVSPGLPMPVQVTARNNIFSSLNPASSLLIANADSSVTPNEFLQNFLWLGERNFFDRYEDFVDYQTLLATSATFTPWTYEDWLMANRSGSYERFSQSRIVLDDLSGLPFHRQPISIYQLDLLDEFDNPARASASDDRNAGADLQMLPQLPGTDELKLTQPTTQPTSSLN